MSAANVDPELPVEPIETTGAGRRLHEARRAANLSLIDVEPDLNASFLFEQQARIGIKG